MQVKWVCTPRAAFNLPAWPKTRGPNRSAPTAPRPLSLSFAIVLIQQTAHSIWSSPHYHALFCVFPFISSPLSYRTIGSLDSRQQQANENVDPFWQEACCFSAFFPSPKMLFCQFVKIIDIVRGIRDFHFQSWLLVLPVGCISAIGAIGSCWSWMLL